MKKTDIINITVNKQKFENNKYNKIKQIIIQKSNSKPVITVQQNRNGLTKNNSSLKKNNNDMIKSKDSKTITISKSSLNINPIINKLKWKDTNSSPLNNTKKKNSTNTSQNEIKIENRAKSALNITSAKREIIRVNSLKPFPKMDPEFYNDNQDYFWNKQLQRVNTENLILFKPNSEKRFLRHHMINFGKSDIFSVKNSNYTNNSTLNSKDKDCLNVSKKKISYNRTRDFHSENKVIAPSEKMSEVYNTYNNFSKNKGNLRPNGIKTVTINVKVSKSKTPMHLKLYESTLQDNRYIKKTQIPQTHPSFNKKDDTFKPVISPSFKKKVDFYKTTYNFLKNYH